MSDDLVKNLRTVSNMINMGEKIRWGEETNLMDEAANRIDADTKLIQEMREALIFYSHEPIYHHRYEPRSCGCCSDTFEPEILDDLGAVAREALAKSQQEGETE
jgi:hypothetical protein